MVHIVDMPIKCPVAPLEFTFLAEAYFRHRGMRDRVEIIYATPLPGAFTKPVASAHLGSMLDEHVCDLVTSHGQHPLTGPAAAEAEARLADLQRHVTFDGKVITDATRPRGIMDRHDPRIYPRPVGVTVSTTSTGHYAAAATMRPGRLCRTASRWLAATSH